MRIFFSILLFTTFSCSQNVTTKQMQFRKFQNSIISEIIENYPIKLQDVDICEAQIINYTEAYNYLGYSSIFQVFKFSNDEFENAKKIVVNNSIANLSYYSKCNFIIPETINSYEKSCDTIKPAIPSLENKVNKLSRFISDSSIFYIFSYGNKNIMKNVKSEKNIFSTGAIIDENKKTIVYWIIAI